MRRPGPRVAVMVGILVGVIGLLAACGAPSPDATGERR